MPKRDDEQLFDNIAQYIALVGRGQKSGKTLNQAQAQHLMSQLLSGDVLPEQTGALLMLLRMREETVEELAGFLQACRATLPEAISSLGTIDVDIGCYAGKRRHLPWFLLSAMVLAENGYKVFMHGLEETDSNRLYLDSVFSKLGWKVAQSVEEASEHLSTFGLCYVSLKQLHPGMTKLLSMRHTLGLRSCMHTLSKMLNPANARASIHGVFHRELDNTHMDVAACLNESHVACIRGDSGEVEATPEKAFVMKYLGSPDAGNASPLDRHFPVTLTKWAHQTRVLTPMALKTVWLGNSQSVYGEAAVITTLAVFLSCIHNEEVEASLERARNLFKRRSKVWPSIV